MTPSNSGRDIRSQMVSAYQTGLNYLGQTVGLAHPGFDMGWMASPVVAAFDGGYFSASMGNVQNHIGIMASFDSASWSAREYTQQLERRRLPVVRVHDAPVLTMGTWRFAVIDPQQDTGATNLVFPDSFKMNVMEVNRAGAGSSADLGSSSTSIGATEAYTCPANLLAPYASFSGTANCIQVKVASPPCQQNPNTSYTFADSNSEKQEFPCNTPGFGTANASWSKLQDMQPGDWLLTNAGSQNENLVLLSTTYNSATNIDLWLLRWAAHNYLAPLFPGKDDLAKARMRAPGCCTWRRPMPPTRQHWTRRAQPIPGPRAILCASLRMGLLLPARWGMGLCILTSSLGLAEAISAQWTPRYQSIVEPSGSVGFLLANIRGEQQRREQRPHAEL